MNSSSIRKQQKLQDALPSGKVLMNSHCIRDCMLTAGLTFEFGKFNHLINALEVSATFDAFAKKIPIMYTDLNNQFFLTLAVSYRFGWVVAARYKTPKITKEGKRKGD